MTNLMKYQSNSSLKCLSYNIYQWFLYIKNRLFMMSIFILKNFLIFFKKCLTFYSWSFFFLCEFVPSGEFVPVPNSPSHFKSYWAMVTSHYLWINCRPFYFFLYVIWYDKVINSPSYIFFSGSSHIRPPTLGFFFFWI